MNDCRLPVNILVGMAIATIGLDLPALAVSQSAPVLVSQVVACVVTKRTAVYKSANPADPEVLGRILPVDTPVALAAPLPINPPARVQIRPNGFVNYAALDCGNKTPSINPGMTTACRKVRGNLNPINVFREPRWASQSLGRVFANESVYVIQSGGVTNTTQDSSGNEWVEIDLQRTFGRNFGLSPSVGWLPAIDPSDQQSSVLVYGCS